jgi:predicted ATPase
MQTDHPLNAESRPMEAPSTHPVIRTPDQRVRVFVSSTLDELAPERAAARAAITQLRLTPVLFELGARPYPPRELYRAYLAQSDIFIGLYWQRYGWVAPTMQVSGLEDEYQLSGAKPKLIYIETPAPEREQDLHTLLDRIRTEDTASYQKFATPEELRERIANDLAQLLTERFTTPAETPVAARLAALPVPRRRLIDREQERAQAQALLQQEDVGLVTLTGPGGVGKTRLAVQVAADLVPQFTDGVAFISLASLKDPTLVVPTVARALGVSQTGDDSLDERLLEYLQPRDVLLVLDNAEQLVSAALLAAQALELAPRLKLLVTSREPLRVRDEQIVPVPPLALPDPAHIPDLDHLVQIPAVALFVERAREARPDFALTSENAAPIVEICQRLDGLPLALELAAAVLSLLPPAALLARLERRLPLPSRGARDLPERQQTLRNTIAWSYDLLEEGEQQLFRRLSVFAGGFTLEAVQAVCVFAADETSSPAQADDGAVLEQLGQLLDKSLVQTQQDTGGEPRFTLLETIREYATEQLAASGEQAALQQRHAHYFLKLAEEMEPHLSSPEGDIWLERLSREDANLRAALTWSKANQDAVETGLRLAGVLYFYWFLLGSLREGRTWLEEMLARTASTERSAARGRALLGAGMLAWAEGDYEAASPCAEESLSIVREAGDKRLTGWAESVLGLVRFGQGNTVAARPLLEESRTLFKDLGDVWNEAFTLYALGSVVYGSGDPAAARAFYEESLRLFQGQGDVHCSWYASLVLSSLQVVVSTQGDQEMARFLDRQLQPLMQRARNRGALVLFLINIGDIWLHRWGDKQQAKVLYRESLSLWRNLQRVEQGIGIIKALAGLAEVAAAQGQAERAGRLLGAADSLLPSDSVYREDVNRHVAEARANLDAVTFEAGWSAGQTMTEEQAITEALQDA